MTTDSKSQLIDTFIYFLDICLENIIVSCVTNKMKVSIKYKIQKMRKLKLSNRKMGKNHVHFQMGKV